MQKKLIFKIIYKKLIFFIGKISLLKNITQYYLVSSQSLYQYTYYQDFLLISSFITFLYYYTFLLITSLFLKYNFLNIKRSKKFFLYKLQLCFFPNIDQTGIYVSYCIPSRVRIQSTRGHVKSSSTSGEKD